MSEEVLVGAERSVVWESAEGAARIEGGGTLKVRIQRWDLVGQPLFLRLMEHDKGRDDPIGRVGGTIKSEGEGKAAKFWFEAGPLGWESTAKVAENQRPWATFNLEVPKDASGGLAKFENIALQGGEFEEGQFEISLAITDAGGKVLEPPGGHHLLATLSRSLNEAKVLDRFTPYLNQFASSSLGSKVANTPLGFTPSSWSFKKLGCGHCCTTRCLMYWGEFKDPKAFVLRAGLAESWGTGKDRSGTPYNPLPYKSMKSGKSTRQDLREHERWTRKELIEFDGHEAHQAALLFAWWWRQYYVFREFPQSLNMSKRFLEGWLPKFPYPPDHPTAPVRYEVTEFTKGGLERTLGFLCEQPAVPVIFCVPGHWMTAVGFERYKGRSYVIVHDSGNWLRRYKTPVPPNYKGDKRLHFMRVSDFKQLFRVGLAIKCLDPRESIPHYP